MEHTHSVKPLTAQAVDQIGFISIFFLVLNAARFEFGFFTILTWYFGYKVINF